MNKKLLYIPAAVNFSTEPHQTGWEFGGMFMLMAAVIPIAASPRIDNSSHKLYFLKSSSQVISMLFWGKSVSKFSSGLQSWPCLNLQDQFGLTVQFGLNQNTNLCESS